MLVRFHGVRGSNPTCDVRTWNYGGNTPCVEVETPVGHRIIIDGGTGLRSLSHAPGWGPDSVPIQASWLVSHYHWDHTQGLPFFAPLYEARNQFDLYGLKPDGGGGMEATLQGQMLRPYFPVDMSLLAAARAFTVVDPWCRWQIEDATVEAVALNHPQGCLGFRIETAVTNLDGLDTVESIKVCIGYRDGKSRFDYVPNDIRVLTRCQPVYAEFPGWRTPTQNARKWKDLPAKARAYLKAIAELTGAKLGNRFRGSRPRANDPGLTP